MTLREKYKAVQEIDLKGKPVFPGFIDPHCHFYSYGLTLRQADLSGTTSTKEIADRLVQHVALNPGKWVIGTGLGSKRLANQKISRQRIA